MKNLVSRTASRVALYAPMALAVFACSRGAESNQDSTQVAQSSTTASSDSAVTLRGTVASLSATQLILKVDTGNVTVALSKPIAFYTRVPSDLSHVKQSTFIGVTTVKQPDGSELATEIHIFPEELRGVGEGSRMMGPNPNASRMTNGNVSQSRMTNGTASPSRMSNGNVSSTNGSSLVVQYAGGSQTVTVPPNTRVTELKLSAKPLAAGDQVAVLAKRAPDGSLTSERAISTAR